MDGPSSTSSETCDAWYGRYHATERERGRAGAIGLWRTWIAPSIGPTAMVDVTAADIERIRDRLDDAIAAWRRAGGDRARGARISGRTAMSAWWCLTAAFRSARTSKLRDLRILAGRPNPCADVEPPGDAESRRARVKTFIYPAECARLLGCGKIPRPWRELHALAAYSYLRPGELRVLRWKDVDLDHARIHVERAWSRAGRTTKPPKTPAGVRDVPIEPALVPLLRRMRRGRDSSDLVVRVMVSRSTDTLAWRTRGHLTVAGVTRPALHETTLVTARANFRSWRDSGLTWLALAGVDALRIMRRAGHADIATTMGYVKIAEDPGGRLGRPFAPLPRELVRGRG